MRALIPIATVVIASVVGGRLSESSAGEHITAVATYSEFRRFETAGRLIMPPK